MRIIQRRACCCLISEEHLEVKLFLVLDVRVVPEFFSAIVNELIPTFFWLCRFRLSDDINILNHRFEIYIYVGFKESLCAWTWSGFRDFAREAISPYIDGVTYTFFLTFIQSITEDFVWETKLKELTSVSRFSFLLLFVVFWTSLFMFNECQWVYQCKEVSRKIHLLFFLFPLN